MEAEHEEPDILHQHGDQPEQQPGGHGDGGVAPLGQHLLLDADQVDHDGAKDEAVEEHQGLEAAVAEKGANHAEHKVEGAHRGSVGVILSDNLDMLLKTFCILKSFPRQAQPNKHIRDYLNLFPLFISSRSTYIPRTNPKR